MILLDTCALVWLASGDKRLSKEARETIGEAKMVYVSSITAFEIALKYARGGLDLPCDPAKWFHDVLSHHDVEEVPVDSIVAITATKLPEIHRDPCDRFIIATARLRKLTIVTADPRFKEYEIPVIG